MRSDTWIILLKWLAKRPVYLKKEIIQLWERILYQPRSRFLLHAWHAHRCPCEAVIFYTFFGRLFWGLRELLALLSGGRLFAKSIVLEGFDRTTDSTDPAKMLWPPSPFITETPVQPDSSFLQKIAQSYHLARSRYPDRYPHTSDWETIAERLKRLLFDETGAIRVETLKNFRARHLFERIIGDTFTQVDPDKPYLSEYLKAIDLVLAYHRTAAVVSPEILATLSESSVGGTTCVRYRGLRLSEKLLFYATVTEDLTTQIPQNGSRMTILDIGTGFAALPHILKHYYPDACFILTELPEVLALAAYYLRANMPDARIALLSDLEEDGDLSVSTAAYDFILIPPQALEKVGNDSVDLVINTVSMGFLTSEYLDFYMRQIDRVLKRGGYFYSINKTETCAWGVGMHAWPFHASFVTLHYRYDNRFSYPQWLGRKIA